jgi:hypothetical protein
MSFGLDFVNEVKRYYVSTQETMTLLEMYNLIKQEFDYNDEAHLPYNKLISINILRAHFIQWQNALTITNHLKINACRCFLKLFLEQWETLEEQVDNFNKMCTFFAGSAQTGDLLPLPDLIQIDNNSFPTVLAQYFNDLLSSKEIGGLLSELQQEDYTSVLTFSFSVFVKECKFGTKCYRKDQEHKNALHQGKEFKTSGVKHGPGSAGKTSGKTSKHDRGRGRGRGGRVKPASGGFRKVSKKRYSKKSKKSSKRIVKSRKRPIKSRKRKLK